MCMHLISRLGGAILLAGISLAGCLDATSKQTPVELGIEQSADTATLDEPTVEAEEEEDVEPVACDAAAVRAELRKPTPPPKEDVQAWTDWHEPPDFDWLSDAVAVSGSGRRCNALPQERVVIRRDSALSLARIHPALTGTLHFDWKPIYDKGNDKEKWNTAGIQSFTVRNRAAKAQTIALRDLLLVEAYTYEHSERVEKKEVRFVDLNFDGYADLCMDQTDNRALCFLFDPQRGSFHPEGLQALGYPTVDPEKGLLHSYSGGTAAGTSFDVYELDRATGQYRPVMSFDSFLNEIDGTQDDRKYYKLVEYFDISNGKRNRLRADSTYLGRYRW